MHYIIGPAPSARALAHSLGLRRDQWHHIDKPSDLPRCRFDFRRPFLATDDWVSLPDWEAIYIAVANMADEEVLKKAGMVLQCKVWEKI